MEHKWSRQGYCELRNHLVDFYDLRRTQVEYLRGPCENLLTHSAFDTDGWDTDLSVDNTEGLGVNPDLARARFNWSDDTLSADRGTTVLTGSGYLECASGLDFTSYGDSQEIEFAVTLAPYHLATTPVFTAKVQLGDDGGSNVVEGSEITVDNMIRLKIRTTKSALDTAGVTLSDVRARIVITGSDPYFWFDSAQVCTQFFDKFVATTGAAVTITTPIRSMRMLKVCSDCYEEIHSKSERFNKEAERAPDVVPAVAQDL